MNEKGKTPAWARDYACAVVRGYEARRRYMERYGSDGNKVYRLYARLNGLVDKAFDEVCEPGERKWIWLAIVDCLSWERAMDYPGSKWRYYMVKNTVIDRLARLLNVC